MLFFLGWESLLCRKVSGVVDQNRADSPPLPGRMVMSKAWLPLRSMA